MYNKVFTSEEQLQWFMKLLNESDEFEEENLSEGMIKFRISYAFVPFNGKVIFFVLLSFQTNISLYIKNCIVLIVFIF